MWLFCLFMVVKFSSAQVNLSPNGTATQSSTYTDNMGAWSAHFAIDDGGPTHEWTSYSCTHTGDDGKTRIWWMVSFEEQLYISNVVIYYRKSYPGRLAGYSLYVTNTTISNENIDFSTGYLCYHHTGTDVPNILQNVTCDQVGSNVIIYNERLPEVTYPSSYLKPPFLELCDVQVIGCKKGYFGKNCQEKCDGCISIECAPETGVCKDTTRCNPGWKKGNEKCNVACDDGYFDDCTKECHCLVDFCDKPSGMCQNGQCQRGWMLDTCSEECIHGHYGYDCTETCDTCNNSSCDRFDGNCTDGCKQGYGGFRCKFREGQI